MRSTGSGAKYAGALALAVAFAGVFAVRAGGGVDWPTWHGSTALTGAADTVLPENPSPLWRRPTGAPVRFTPVAGGGRIFVVTDAGRILAFNTDGREAWSRQVAGVSAPGAAPRAESFAASVTVVDGTVVAVGEGGVVHAFDAATGKDRWSYDTGEAIQSAATFYRADDGATRVIAFNQATGKRHGIDLKTGSAAWTADGTGRSDGAIAQEGGRIVFGGCDAAVSASSARDGSALGSVALGEGCEIAGGVAVVGDLAFTGNRRGQLACVNLAEGAVVWTNNASAGELFTTPAVSGDRVVVADGDGRLHCADAKTGRTLWTFNSGARSAASPVIAGAHVVAALDGTLYLLRLRDGTKVWSRAISDEITSPAIVGDSIVIGAGEGFVMAFGAKDPAARPGRDTEHRK